MWKRIRIAILLFVFTTVAQQAWLAQSDLAWKDNFYIAVYPINADGSEKVSAYLATLTRNDFEPMAEYFAQAAKPYQLGLRRPVEVQLGAQVNVVPPVPPLNATMLENMIWSLKFRFFAWRHSPKVKVNPAIRLYLLYYDPQTHVVLKHSTALNKGRIARVNLFGDRAHAKQNLVVLAHELLHTLNATDKYDLANGQPIYPDGFAEPSKMPRYPQELAELMGGYVPISEMKSLTPASLDETVIGEKTAREIGWLK